MALLDELRADQLAARKLNDRLKADLLTTLIGEGTQITTEEFKRGVTEVTDGKLAATVAKFLKNTKLTLESLAGERARLLEAGGDTRKVDERIKAAETELAILSSYGPKQMTESELREAISDFRAKNPDANVGTIMAHLKNSFSGQYDGKAASVLARG
ncbi:GatB/YqeY domain-containing protein [Phenylobacterium sp. J426]|uniref:GatB/YqeY domain-containing protein n=1 Tax=Phenylobacterium sp. J426 TaxID=2898439 RepID=UPI0021507F40|nr:GatB/YqeY domain-containing protein [Phenylobacterium sp. J426]MCR5873265.1 GatB/YqeY domain-containing protein [Phenylobacterium sp. J426]